MKNTAKIALVAAAMMLSLTACGGRSDTAQTAAETQALEEPDMGSITNLGQYIGVKLTEESTYVSDEEVDEMIQTILDANPDYIEVDRPAEDGDRVNIDYAGYMDGEQFDGGTADNYYLTIGSNSFIDGFEDGLIGAEAGEVRDLELTFPENYSSGLAGRDVTFTVTVNSVEEVVPAVLDDDFVQMISGFSTVDEFREEILSEIQDYKTESAELGLQRQALNAVADTSTFDLNQDFLDQNLEYNMSYAENMAEMYGMELDEFLSYFYNMNYDEFEEYCIEMIEEQMKQTMIVDAIAEKENFKLTEEDLQYTADKLYADLDELKENDQEYLESNAIAYKVANFIIDNADITEEAPVLSAQDEDEEEADAENGEDIDAENGEEAEAVKETEDEADDEAEAQ